MILDKIKNFGFGALLLSLSLVSGTAKAATESSSHMATSGSTSAPFGHVVFCKNNGGQCRKRGSGTKRFSQKSWRQLASVNSSVNRSIRPKDDGKLDKWQTNVRVGDCEDYALTKRARLLSAGWPSSALLITTGYLRSGSYHAVLVARTDRGDFVLDNLSGSVKPWRRVGYRWKKQQSASNPRQWVKLTGGSRRPIQLVSQSSPKRSQSAAVKFKSKTGVKTGLKAKSKRSIWSLFGKRSEPKNRRISSKKNKKSLITASIK